MTNRAKASLVATSWGCQGWGSVRATSSAPMGALALAHRDAQPCLEAGRHRLLLEPGPASLGGKIGAGDRFVVEERLHGWAFVVRDLGAGEQAASPVGDGDIVKLIVLPEEQQADTTGDATAAGGSLDNLVEYGLEA